MQTGIRISENQRRKLNQLAVAQCNTVSGIIRLAIDQMIKRYGRAPRRAEKKPPKKRRLQ